MSDPYASPDIAGTLTGYRCWGLAETDAGIRLVSHNETIWPAKAPLAATCATGNGHAAPDDRCTCGIYALAEGEGLRYYGYDGPSYAVFGLVSLWGDVIRGTKGFRASHAYPKILCVAHKDWMWAEPLRAAYGVPVRLRNPYPQEAI